MKINFQDYIFSHLGLNIYPVRQWYFSSCGQILLKELFTGRALWTNAKFCALPRLVCEFAAGLYLSVSDWHCAALPEMASGDFLKCGGEDADYCSFNLEDFDCS